MITPQQVKAAAKKTEKKVEKKVEKAEKVSISAVACFSMSPSRAFAIHTCLFMPPYNCGCGRESVIYPSRIAADPIQEAKPKTSKKKETPASA